MQFTYSFIQHKKYPEAAKSLKLFIEFLNKNFEIKNYTNKINSISFRFLKYLDTKTYNFKAYSQISEKKYNLEICILLNDIVLFDKKKENDWINVALSTILYCSTLSLNSIVNFTKIQNDLILKIINHENSKKNN